MSDGESLAIDSGVVSQDAQPVVTDSHVVNEASIPEASVEKPNTEAKPEKLFRRDEVAKIVNAETQKAIEKAKREYEALQSFETLKVQQPIAPKAPEMSASIGNMPATQSYTPEQLQQFVKQEIANEARTQATEMRFQEAISSFSSKIEDAASRHSDFHEVVNKLGFDKMPEQTLKSVVALFNVADNGADVLYDVASHPTKYAGIVNLIAINPNLAIHEIQRLSSSIKENARAASTPVANPPLSQVNPSPTGADNGAMTLREMKKQPWARG